MINPMADPDLQIKMGVGGGGGHPDPEIRGGGLKNFFFRPLRPQFSLKISGEGGGGSPGPLPWIRHCNCNAVIYIDCERFEPRSHFENSLSLIVRVNIVLNLHRVNQDYKITSSKSRLQITRLRAAATRATSLLKFSRLQIFEHNL